MTSLVTGATGFVGSAVVRRLLDVGHEVRVLVRADSNRANLKGLKIQVAEGDLRDRLSLDQAVTGCDALFHVAADYRLWSLRPKDLYDSNVDGSLNIVSAAADAGVARIIYTSSVATLGVNADGTPATEQASARLEQMVGHYKRSKFIAERELRKYALRQRLSMVIVNPSTPIGPRDIKPTPTGRVILQAAAGRMPAYVNTGLNIVHVEDVADGHLLAYEKGKVGERYILGGEDMTLQSILAEVAQLSGRRFAKVKVPRLLVLPLAYLSQGWARFRRSKTEPLLTVDGLRMSQKMMFFSSEKARRQLGYAPRPARAALQDAVDWFKANDYC